MLLEVKLGEIDMSINKQFARYVSQNILGMMGVSLYILADTFFISMAEGADGITALNLVLPLYAVIYAIGAMVGVGSAIRYRLCKAKGDIDADKYFANAILWALILSVPFMVVGGMFPATIMQLLGADAVITAVGTPYTRVFMVFTPFFMLNTTFNAFVRNDDDPSLAMAATLSSSLFNIVFDYILMFPCGLGMTGAALATGFSPVIGVLICSIHFFKKKNTLSFVWQLPSVKRCIATCQLGISAFVGELSSGVTTAVYNWLILEIAGNIGVAAYGVVANIALVATSMFNGVAQGSQPLISEFYGKGDKRSANKVLKLSLITAVVMALVILGGIVLFAEPIVAVFNSERSVELAEYAIIGIQLYFVGFIFAGINIAGCGYLSATSQAKAAFVASVARGFVAIVVCAIVMAILFGMTGVWLSFAAAELVTFLILLYILFRKK